MKKSSRDRRALNRHWLAVVKQSRKSLCGHIVWQPPDNKGNIKPYKYHTVIDLLEIL